MIKCHTKTALSVTISSLSGGQKPKNKTSKNQFFRVARDFHSMTARLLGHAICHAEKTPALCRAGAMAKDGRNNKDVWAGRVANCDRDDVQSLALDTDDQQSKVLKTIFRTDSQ
jgi:hypothetical protein